MTISEQRKQEAQTAVPRRVHRNRNDAGELVEKPSTSSGEAELGSS